MASGSRKGRFFSKKKIETVQWTVSKPVGVSRTVVSERLPPSAGVEKGASTRRGNPNGPVDRFKARGRGGSERATPTIWGVEKGGFPVGLFHFSCVGYA